MSGPKRPVLRFAPSPNGELHLGHAYSALVNQALARKLDGSLLLRIEDIDTQRCTPALEKQMLEDLEWIGLEWEGKVLRQSQSMDRYQETLEALEQEGLVYPSTMSRGEIRRQIELNEESSGNPWPRDPDGVPLYPGKERELDADAREQLKGQSATIAFRLDMHQALERMAAIPSWREHGAGPAGESGSCSIDPAKWGDVLLGRKDVPASYHLCCVLDDALTGIDLVVRGRDLFAATAVHRLLQELLGLPVPDYYHHDLILDETGRKLSKSLKDTSLRQLKDAGLQPDDVKRIIGFDESAVPEFPVL